MHLYCTFCRSLVFIVYSHLYNIMHKLKIKKIKLHSAPLMHFSSFFRDTFLFLQFFSTYMLLYLWGVDFHILVAENAVKTCRHPSQISNN